MAISLNQDIRAGKSTYHVQTEYYKTSNKIISNIFKDGKAVKRLEKEVEEGRDLDEQIKEFHNSIIERLTKPTLVKKKKKEEKKPLQKVQKEVFTLTEYQEEKIAAVIYPFFGIATYLVISDAASSASSKEEFVKELLSELEEEKAKELREEILSILSEKEEEKPSESEREQKEQKVLDFPEKELTELLSPYFGIMTAVVLESARRVWDGNKEKLLNFLADELDDEVREEVLEKVNSLFGEIEENSTETKVEEEEKTEVSQQEEPPVAEKRKIEKSQVEKMLPILQEYFGISAAMVAEDAFEGSEGEVDKFLDIILSEVDEREREELEKKLRNLLEGS
jgi:hypothetical protein